MRGVTAEMYVNGLKLMTLTWQHSGGQAAGSDFEGYGEVFFADRVCFHQYHKTVYTILMYERHEWKNNLLPFNKMFL